MIPSKFQSRLCEELANTTDALRMHDEVELAGAALEASEDVVGLNVIEREGTHGVAAQRARAADHGLSVEIGA